MDESSKREYPRVEFGLTELLVWAAAAAFVLSVLPVAGAGPIDCAIALSGIVVLALARSVLSPRYALVAWMLLLAAAGAGVSLQQATSRFHKASLGQDKIVFSFAWPLFWGLLIGGAIGFIAFRIAGLDRRWFRFSVRTLLIGVILLSVLLSSHSVITQQAKRQKEAVRAVNALGGCVRYEWQTGSVTSRGSRSPKSSWLRYFLGDDYFDKVVLVNFVRSEVTDEGLKVLRGLRELESLNLGRTHVTDKGMGHLQGLTNLQSLNLGATLVSGTGLEHLKGLSNLKYLGLARTQVTELGHLQGLSKLKILVLSNTQVTDAALVQVRKLMELEYLSLTDTHVTDTGLAGLHELKNLHSLSLRNTQVTDTGLERLHSLANLRVLNLSGTLVTQQGVKEFRQAQPRCRIGTTDPNAPWAYQSKWFGEQ